MNKCSKNQKGFSLVEVVCAVAIFALVCSIVAGVASLSARIYNSGVTETSLQQEAQSIANQIGNLIKDANLIQSVPCEDFNSGSISGYQIGTSDTKGYLLEKKDDQINYYTYTKNTDGTYTISDDALLAEHVTEFAITPDADFETSRAVNLVLKLSNGSKTYDMNYTMTARNEVVQNISFNQEANVTMDCETEIVMVPGETWNLMLAVEGNSGGIEIECSDGVSVPQNEYSQATIPSSLAITLDPDVTDAEKTITIKTKNLQTDSTEPLVKKTITIKVRRVNSITVQCVKSVTGTTSKTYEEAGAYLTFYANVNVFNGSRKVGKEWDDNYRQPTAVEWTAAVTVNGETKSLADYFEKVEESGSDTNTPYIKYKVIRNMPSGLELTVTATSLHRRGENKNGTAYYDTAGNDEDITGSYTVIPRVTQTITLEPNETWSKTFNMFDEDAEVELSMQGNSDESTTAVYHNRTLTITLGANEQGNDYKFTVRVTDKARSDVAVKIAVYVRRIDVVSIGVFDDKDAADTKDFRLRYNTSDGVLEHMNADALIQDTVSGTTDTETLENALATRITWEVLDKNGNTVVEPCSVVMTGKVVRLKEGGKVSGSDKYISESEYTVSSDFYSIVHVKRAVLVIYEDESGNETSRTLKQLPEIDITDYKKLPSGYELRVTMESLHPYNSDGTPTNKNHTAYASDAVKATASLYGDGSMVITNSAIKRGSPYTSDTEGTSDVISLSNAINQKYGVSTEARYYFRLYDYKTGQWTQYYKTAEQGNPLKLNEKETELLLPDRAYDIELIKTVCDLNNKRVYYPTGLAGTAGSGFEDFKEGTYELDGEYTITNATLTFHVNAAQLVFDSSYNLGSQSSPIALTQASGTYEAKITDAISLNISNTGATQKDKLFPMLVQKYENGSWVTVTSGSYDFTSWKITQYDNADFRISVTGSGSGLYRIGVGVKAANYKTVSGDAWNPIYTALTSPSEFALYDEYADTGFIYLQIN